ncbi:MAG: hypothetical protein B6245_09535 [Desulfobacteraceae bacterium 4572_88]|nr:MAG: hypothetical protein B6245_09535 [Desulfobacteraceae bacterium 4572_88]
MEECKNERSELFAKARAVTGRSGKEQQPGLIPHQQKIASLNFCTPDERQAETRYSKNFRSAESHCVIIV